ncbi:MAG: hypothetical protein JNG89_21325 [Planctomycetaceae bacterium]|nr:hypothetical protein [Planctomycetaceae bacterium]
MSGKPSAKPAAPKPAVAAKPQAAAAAAATGKPGAPAGVKKRPSAEELDDGTDPFEVDTRSIVKAPPVSPKPAKGRMQRVVCPMCETPGFISPQQVGKEVKCCNPQCLMPIFTVPKPKEKPVEEEPKRSLSGIIFAVAAVALVAAVGAALYHFVIKEESAGKAAPVAGGPTPVPTQRANGESVLVARTPKGPEGPPPIALDEVRTTSLTEVERAAQRGQNNRSKPFGRRMSAEAFASAGEFDKAREQLADMQKVAGYEPYFEVEPLVSIASGLTTAGDAAGATAALNDALAKIASVPKLGRDSFDAAGRLAAALVIAGRTDDARGVAALSDDSGMRGRAGVLWRIALDSGTLDLDTPAGRPWLHDMPSAQWVNVTLSLIAQGHESEALAWAQAAGDPAVRDNAVAAWAGTLAQSGVAAGGGSVPPSVTNVIPGLSPAGQARVWAAIADAQQLRGDKTAAEQSLSQAVAALDSLPVSVESLKVPNLKAIYDSDGQPRAGLPDPAAGRAAALAAADVAQVQASLGDVAAAWTTMTRAVAHLRGTAPSPAATTALLDECEQNRSGLEAKLKSALALEDAQLFLAFNRYRKQCGVIHDEATARFDLQVRLLRRTAAFGVLQPLWEEIAARERQTDSAEREPYFATLLPGTIVAYASVAKQAELVSQVQQAIPANKLRIDARDRLALAFPAAIDGSNMRQAADMLRSYDQQEPGDYYTSQVAALRGISRLLKAGNTDKALDLVMNTIDPLLREDGVLLIAAAVVRDDRHSDVWRKRSQFGLSATEQAAFFRGCMLGLKLRPPATAETPETAAR